MDSTLTVLLCVAGFVVLVLVILLASSIRVVPEYQRLVIFRLGRCLGAKGPGLIILIPVVDQAKMVDLREQIREVPHQTSITKDNAPISIDFLWYYKVLDPAESVLKVGNFELSAAGIAATTLRAVIGGIPLDDVLQSVNTSIICCAPAWMKSPNAGVSRSPMLRSARSFHPGKCRTP